MSRWVQVLGLLFTTFLWLALMIPGLCVDCEEVGWSTRQVLIILGPVVVVWGLAIAKWSGGRPRIPSDTAMKQVIVVDRSLEMPAGKLGAQVAHGSVAAYLDARPDAQAAWLACGMPKVVLAVDDQDALTDLQATARDRGIAHGLIRDAGKTVLEPGTVTCLGLGPAEVKSIDSLTGALPLLK